MVFQEKIADDEQSRFEGYGRELAELQKKRAASGKAIERALHVKQHLGLVGTLTVTASERVRSGVFAEQGKIYPVYVRTSNGSGVHQPDKAPDVRGLVLKLVGVEGKKLIPGLENELTQDFLFLNDPALPFRDPVEFMAFQRAAAAGPAWLLPKLFAQVGLGRGFAILRRALSSPKVGSIATNAFHTAGALSLAGSAAKLGLFPVPSPVRPPLTTDNRFREDLTARLQAGSLSWSVRAQMYKDDQSTPIEDASVVWSGPWLELGTLTLPQQDPSSPRGQEISALVSSFSFDPWHAIEAHRPLGAI
ncbi:MAG: hypothetical protein ABW061_23630, partial [Polyangiaceae bacterium]